MSPSSPTSLTDRVIRVTHANWGGSRGKVEENVTVVDVSADGDWSRGQGLVQSDPRPGHLRLSDLRLHLQGSPRPLARRRDDGLGRHRRRPDPDARHAFDPFDCDARSARSAARLAVMRTLPCTRPSPPLVLAACCHQVMPTLRQRKRRARAGARWGRSEPAGPRRRHRAVLERRTDRDRDGLYQPGAARTARAAARPRWFRARWRCSRRRPPTASRSASP